MSTSGGPAAEDRAPLPEPPQPPRGRKPTVDWSDSLVRRLVADREEGATLASLARSLGVSRERVRQVLTQHGYGYLTGKSADARASARAARNAADAEAIRALITADPTLTWRNIADAIGISQSRVFALVSDDERAMKASAPQDRRKFTDDMLISALKAASRDLNRTLTYTSFQSWSRRRNGMPSAALITFRFGSWASALDAADLPKNAPRRRSQAFRLSEEHLAGWVARYLKTGKAPSANGYDQWAKTQQGAPSASLIRHRIGWSTAREKARYLLETDADLTDLPGTGLSGTN